VDAREAVLAKNSKVLDFQLKCAGVHGNLGDIYLHRGNLPLAAAEYDRTRTLLAELVETEPNEAAFQRELALAHYRLGNLALRSADPAAATQQFEASRKIWQDLVNRDESSDRRQMELMLAHAHCGDHELAAAIARKYAAHESPDNEMLIDVARCLAQCSAAADDGERRAAYAKEAIDALDKAITHGYRDTVYLECEPDFDPLRKLDEFTAQVEKSRR
jgi:tetratricopeptide (TPR) repeat protein